MVVRARHALVLALALALLSVMAPACNTAELKPAPVLVDPGDGHVDEDEEEPDAAPDGGAPDGDPGQGLPTLAMSRDVTVQVLPKAGADVVSELVAVIKGADKSVHMSMYLLSNSRIIDALVDSKRAGNDVKVVLNKTFPPNGGDNTNAYEALSSRGVPVRWAPAAYTFTHSKMIIVDSARVLIMTMNLTHSSPTTNREYIATNTDPDDVAITEQLFDADFSNKAVKVSTKLVVSPADASGLEPREHLRRLIGLAERSLDVEVQTLSDTTVVDAIVAAQQAGVAVRVVLSGETTVTPAQSAAVAKLKQNGVPIRSLSSPNVHAKAIVVDGKYAYIGSHNMTANSLTQNREVGVITDAEAEAAKMRAVIAADYDKGRDL